MLQRYLNFVLAILLGASSFAFFEVKKDADHWRGQADLAFKHLNAYQKTQMECRSIGLKFPDGIQVFYDLPGIEVSFNQKPFLILGEQWTE